MAKTHSVGKKIEKRILRAFKEGDVDALREIIQQGQQHTPNFVNVARIENDPHSFLEMTASVPEHPGRIFANMLFDLGAVSDTPPNPQGNTPATLATSFNNLWFLQLLHDRGELDVNKTYPTTSKGLKINYSLIHVAVGNGYIEVVQWLLERGADPTYKKTENDISAVEFTDLPNFSTGRNNEYKVRALLQQYAFQSQTIEVPPARPTTREGF